MSLCQLPIAPTYKKLNALVIAKELAVNGGNSNHKNGTCDKTNSNMENDIINEHNKYLPKHYGIKLNSKMETLSLMYWIPKIHTNPAG